MNDEEDDDPDNTDEKCRARYDAIFWHPFRDAALNRILTSVEGMAPEIRRPLLAGAQEADEGGKYAAVVASLGLMLGSHNASLRRDAARLLDFAFSVLRESRLLSMGEGIPDELKPVLPAMLNALEVADSELRLTLLRTLESVAHRRSMPAMSSSIVAGLFKDCRHEVVAQAVKVVMATGIDRASVAIREIIGLLRHSATNIRLAAGEALAVFGEEANDATIELMHLIQTDEELKERAVSTLLVVADFRAASNAISSEADRAGFLSLLRNIGPPARNLRLHLQGAWSAPRSASEGREDAQKSTEEEGFSHSDDYRSVCWNGRTFSFSPGQAACVKVLWEHWRNNTPEVGGDFLLEAAEVKAGRMSLLFSGHPAWNTMIVQVPKKKNLYRLNLSRRS